MAIMKGRREADEREHARFMSLAWHVGLLVPLAEHAPKRYPKLEKLTGQHRAAPTKQAPEEMNANMRAWGHYLRSLGRKGG